MMNIRIDSSGDDCKEEKEEEEEENFFNWDFEVDGWSRSKTVQIYKYLEIKYFLVINFLKARSAELKVYIVQ